MTGGELECWRVHIRKSVFPVPENRLVVSAYILAHLELQAEEMIRRIFSQLPPMKCLCFLWDLGSMTYSFRTSNCVVADSVQNCHLLCKCSFKLYKTPKTRANGVPRSPLKLPTVAWLLNLSKSSLILVSWAAQRLPLCCTACLPTGF